MVRYEVVELGLLEAASDMRLISAIVVYTLKVLKEYEVGTEEVHYGYGGVTITIPWLQVAKSPSFLAP